MTVGPEGEREQKEKGEAETMRRRASVLLHVHICIKTYRYNTDMISCMYLNKIHTYMHKHMHTIQTGAYPIYTVHMTYARRHCTLLYWPACACMCMYHMFLRSVSYAYVSVYRSTRVPNQKVCILSQHSWCASETWCAPQPHA
jgi:hypothetical protein